MTKVKGGGFSKISLLFCIAFSAFFAFTAHAAWNGQPYAEGATLNPECSPVQANCTVTSTALTLQQVTNLGYFTNRALGFAGASSTGNIIPTITNSYDLGGTAIYWRRLYATNVSSTNIDALGYVSTTNLWVNGSQILSANPNLQQVTDQGYFTTRAIGFAGASSTGNIIPTTNNFYNLGSASKSWQNVYASGTYYGGTGVNIVRPTAVSNGEYAFYLSGTAAASPASVVSLSKIDFTGAGSKTETQIAQGVYVYAGYTGGAGSRAQYLYSGSAATGTQFNLGYGNYGGLAYAAGSHDFWNIGYEGIAREGLSNFGLVGNATQNKNSGTNVGVTGLGLNKGSAPVQIGGYFALRRGDTPNIPTLSAALIADNGTQTSPILRLQDNGTDVMTVIDGGNVGIGTSNPYLYKLTVAGTIAPSTTNSYDLGSNEHAWRRLYATNVSSTNIDALGYVSTTNLYINGSASIASRLSIPATVAGKGPFMLDFGTTLFNGTPDPRMMLGYNMKYDGTMLQGSEGAFALGVEGDYNDGAAHRAEMYIDYLSTNGLNHYRPWYSTIDKSTNAIINSLQGRVDFLDTSGINGGGATYSIFNPTTGYVSITSPTIAPSLPVERLDVRSGNLYVRSLYPGTGNTPTSTKIFFEAVQSGGFRVGGAGMQVNYTRISDGDYASGLSFYTSNDNVPVENMTLTKNGGLGIGTTNPYLFKLTVAGSVAPSTTNSYDLGGTSNYWRKLYATNADFTGGVTTTQLGVTNLPASAAALQPLCVSATGVVGHGTGGVCPVSALSVKNILGASSYGLEQILNTNFYDYTFKDGRENNRLNVGPVADYLKSSMPSLVLYDTNGNVLGYDYISMIAVEGQAIKDLNVKIEDAQNQIDAIKASQATIPDSMNSLIVFGTKVLDDALNLGHDSVGQAKILSGDTKVTILFEKEYTYEPIVALTPLSKMTGSYWINAVTTKGFTIELEQVQTSNSSFGWHAFGSKAGKVFSSDGNVSDVVLSQDVLQMSPMPGQIAPSTPEQTSPPPGPAAEAAPTPDPVLIPDPTPVLTPDETTTPATEPEPIAPAPADVIPDPVVTPDQSPPVVEATPN